MFKYLVTLLLVATFFLSVAKCDLFEEDECVSRRDRRNSTYWIGQLNLALVPALRTYINIQYTSESTVAAPAAFFPSGSMRPYGIFVTALIKAEEPGVVHKLPVDLVINWLHGSTMRVYVLEDGKVDYTDIGVAKGKFSVNIKAGMWFATVVKNKNPGKFSIYGVTESPGVLPSDLVIGNRNELLAQYPDHEDLITKVTTEA